MSFDIAIAVTVSAVFFGFIGCLIGFNVREKRHAATLVDSRDAYLNWEVALRKQLTTALGEQRRLQANVDFMVQSFNALAAERNKLNAELGELGERHAYADTYRKAVVDCLLRWKAWPHGSKAGFDALTLVTHLGNVAAQQALHPESKEAKKLITRGVRKANKANRALMVKLALQDAAIAEEERAKFNAEREYFTGELAKVRIQLAEANFSHNMYVGKVHETMEEKLKLSGVRESFRNTLNAKVATIGKE